MIQLKQTSGEDIFINENKIVKFYRVPENISSFEKKEYTYLQLETCAIQVLETPEEIAFICNSKK